jgi:2-polyprenyl-3-methyl-5-hydroxy-6-metoxy-1,4-benzoquinol methylase
MREHVDTAITQADFDRIAMHSSKDEGWNHNNHYHRFLLGQMPAHCEHALEIGCGAGTFARLMAQHAVHVLALDLSSVMIQQAREHSVGIPNIDFEVDDVLSRPFNSGQFDYIASIATLHHIPMEAVLNKMKEALVPGGTLVVLDIYQSRLVDLFMIAAALPANLFMQWRYNRHRPRRSPEARIAWAQHAAHDTYLTLAQVRHICRMILPGARVRRHLFWRYSIVWQKTL